MHNGMHLFVHVICSNEVINDKHPCQKIHNPPWHSSCNHKRAAKTAQIKLFESHHNVHFATAHTSHLAHSRAGERQRRATVMESTPHDDCHGKSNTETHTTHTSKLGIQNTQNMTHGSMVHVWRRSFAMSLVRVFSTSRSCWRSSSWRCSGRTDRW